MQVVLDINENYEAQFIGVLQSLDKKIFKNVKIEAESQFMQDKSYLQEALKNIDDGTVQMLSIEEFDANMDKVLREYAD